MARLKRAVVQDRQAAPNVARCLEAFTLALDAAGRSQETIDNYREAILQFADLVGNPSLDDVTADDVRRWLLALRQAGRKPTTVRSRHHSLRAFFNWAEREGLIERNPMDRISPPAIPETEPAGFSVDELRKLLEVCDAKTTRGARDRAIFLVLLATGLRVGELVQLRKADVVREGRTDQYLRVLGKGSRERLVSLGQQAKEAIALYLLRRGEDDDPALWLGEFGPLKTTGMLQLCNRRGAEAGVAKCHPHRFRNTALAAMLDAGMEASAVQRIAGHRNISMLQHYVGFSEQRRANEALQAAAHVERLGLGAKRKRNSPQR